MNLAMKSIYNNKKKLFVIASTILIIFALFFIFNAKDNEKTIYNDIKLNDFQTKLNSKDDFKIYIYKTGCSACQTIKPVLSEVIKESEKEVFAINMELDENIDVSFLRSQKISRTPTLLHYKNGKEVDRLQGVQSKENLQKFFGK